MNPLPSRSFRLRLLRAKGPAPYQPRATPWVIRPERPSPEGAAQPPRRNMARPRGHVPPPPAPRIPAGSTHDLPRSRDGFAAFARVA